MIGERFLKRFSKVDSLLSDLATLKNSRSDDYNAVVDKVHKDVKNYRHMPLTDLLAKSESDVRCYVKDHSLTADESLAVEDVLNIFKRYQVIE